jgi:hypothetical protein
MSRNWPRERKIHPLPRFDPCVVRGSPLRLLYCTPYYEYVLRSIHPFISTFFKGTLSDMIAMISSFMWGVIEGLRFFDLHPIPL